MNFDKEIPPLSIKRIHDFPADDFAKNFSYWGENPNLNLSTVIAGVSEAKECLDFLK